MQSYEVRKSLFVGRKNPDLFNEVQQSSGLSGGRVDAGLVTKFGEWGSKIRTDFSLADLAFRFIFDLSDLKLRLVTSDDPPL